MLDGLKARSHERNKINHYLMFINTTQSVIIYFICKTILKIFKFNVNNNKHKTKIKKK